MAGNNQYTKAKALGLPKPEISEETRKRIGNGWRGKKLPIEMKEKIKATVNKNILNDNWHVSFSKVKTVNYKGIDLLGNWELEFAKYLDEKQIKWTKPTEQFYYIFENENHRYFPDFYLPDYDLYIEIKGYPTEKDFSKWEQFNKKLDIYFGDELFNMGIITEFRNVYDKVDSKFRIKHIKL